MFGLIVLMVVVVLVIAAGAAWFLLPLPLAALALAAERRRCGMHLGHARIPGYDVAYLDGGVPGDTREPMVLLHGIGADKDHFTRVAGALRKRFRIIAPDLPGFGDSSRPDDGRYGIHDQVEYVLQFLQQLGLQQVYLGGNSMGGCIAAQLAAAHPRMIHGLWLLAPAGVLSAQDSDMMRRLNDGQLPPLFARTPAEFDAVLAYVVQRKPFVPGVLRRALARRAAANHALHLRIFNQLFAQGQGLEPVADAITAPTLVVWGAEDRVLDPRGAAVLRDAIAGAEMIVMPDVGHLPMLEAVNASAHAWLEFVARRCVSPKAEQDD